MKNMLKDNKIKKIQSSVDEDARQGEFEQTEYFNNTIRNERDYIYRLKKRTFLNSLHLYCTDQ